MMCSCNTRSLVAALARDDNVRGLSFRPYLNEKISFFRGFLDFPSLHSLGMSCARFYIVYIELTLNILIIQKKVLILYRNREKEIPSPYFVVI